MAVAHRGLAKATEALTHPRSRCAPAVSPHLEIGDADLPNTQAQPTLANPWSDFLSAYAALQKAVGTIGERYAGVF